MKALKGKTLNHTITSRVIDLHNQGYTDDFLPVNNYTLLCLQNSVNFGFDDLHIKVIDQGFDQLTKSYKYIHTIETSHGEKGLLITDFICTAPFMVN
ncbi:hypothetical protein FFF34_018955 [Inquilinus sp. KBS0705]|nr:hypothetical protein FFF34_018955 [Inquilinus sp. KBS0705]